MSIKHLLYISDKNITEMMKTEETTNPKTRKIITTEQSFKHKINKNNKIETTPEIQISMCKLFFFQQLQTSFDFSSFVHFVPMFYPSFFSF